MIFTQTQRLTSILSEWGKKQIWNSRNRRVDVIRQKGEFTRDWRSMFHRKNAPIIIAVFYEFWRHWRNERFWQIRLPLCLIPIVISFLQGKIAMFCSHELTFKVELNTIIHSFSFSLVKHTLYWIEKQSHQFLLVIQCPIRLRKYG